MPSSPKPPPARRSRTTLAVPRIEPAEPTSDPKLSMRQRIMQAAHSLLMEQGYGVSTLQIAARAHISKRDLYANFRTKQDIVAACIAGRNVGNPSEPLPRATSLVELAAILTGFGARLLADLCEPDVIAMTRLAITEGARNPEVAQALREHGRGPVDRVISTCLTDAVADGLLTGEVYPMTGIFFCLLIGDVQQRLLMGQGAPPSPEEARGRAGWAVSALIGLHGRGGGSRD